MSKPGYALLQDVIMDADFPDLDLALRRGRHVDREDASWYALLSDAQEPLELFYRRYGCELIHKTDGYFYLLPTGDKISRKQLSAADMLVGQALALLYLDPANIERGGVIAHEDLIAQLSSVLGTDALIAAFNPGTGAGKRKKYDERIAQRNVRNRVGEAVRRLASMGFVDVTQEERVRLRPALMRFAEPVRGLSEPAEALAKLVARGEVALEAEESEAARADDDESVTGGEEPELAAGGGGAEADEDAPAAREDDAEPRSGVTARVGSDASAAASGSASDESEPVSAHGDHAENDVLGSSPGEPGAASSSALGTSASPERASDPEAAASGEASSIAELQPGAPHAFEADAASSDLTAPGQSQSPLPSDQAAAVSSSDPTADEVERPSEPPPSAAPEHPMDRDLDWADIFPEPPDPQEPE